MSKTAVIPRIFHQTHSRRDLPAPIAANVARLRAANPGWEYRFYDDSDRQAFILRECGERFLAAYRRIDPAYGAARADLFRYLLMYRVGGVYLDIKSSTNRPLDQIAAAAHGFQLAKWDNAPGGKHPNWGLHAALADVPGGEFQQWHIIAAPGHRFLAAVIDVVLDNIARYRPWRDDVGRDGVIKLTGPIAFTRAITPLLGGDDYRLADSNANLGLEYSMFGNTDHQQLFGHHYTTNLDPVVRPRGLMVVPAVAYTAWRRLRRMAGRVRRSLLSPPVPR